MPARSMSTARATEAASEPEVAAQARARLAWLVLWAAALTFCLMVVGLILGVRWYRDQALTARVATVDIIGGTVLFQAEETTRETVATNRMRLQDGDRLRTASDGQALISLPDGSNVRLWPDTAVEVKQLRTSTFSSQRTLTLLSQLGGHTRAEVAVPSTQERRFEIQTPHGRILLREGSYRIEITPSGSDVSVRTGSASVTARDQTVEVLRGERTIVAPGGRPTAPITAARDLIRNGDFGRGFEGWRPGSRNEEDSIPGQVSLTMQDGRAAVAMRRQGSQKHGETFVQQTVNRDVTDEVSLRLSMDVKVVDQTLSGGGWRGSEYPLLVRLRYRDAYGSEATLVRGFYVTNPDGHPTTNGTPLPANQWTPMEVDLFDERQVSPRPAYLLWLEVEGAGWDFESYVTGVRLVAD